MPQVEFAVLAVWHIGTKWACADARTGDSRTILGQNPGLPNADNRRRYVRRDFHRVIGAEQGACLSNLEAPRSTFLRTLALIDRGTRAKIQRNAAA